MAVSSEIMKIRKELDNVDDQLINLLDQRFRIVDEVGKVKKEHRIPVYDKEREKAITQKISGRTSSSEFSSEIADIYDRIFYLGRKKQAKTVYDGKNIMLISNELIIPMKVALEIEKRIGYSVMDSTECNINTMNSVILGYSSDAASNSHMVYIGDSGDCPDSVEVKVSPMICAEEITDMILNEIIL